MTTTTQNETELNCIKSYLDRKLFNNEKSLITKIMDYALEECDICDNKQINLWSECNVDCYDSDCNCHNNWDDYDDEYSYDSPQDDEYSDNYFE